MANILGTSGADTIAPGLISGGVTGVIEPDLSGNDSIQGLSDDDQIDGGLGNDTLRGGTGTDTLQGGAGNDTAVFGPGDILAGESFDGGEGEDIADFRPITNADISALALTGVERLIVNGATTIAAGQLADVTAIDSNGLFFFRLIGAAAGTFDFSTITFGSFYQGFTGSAGDDRVIGTATGDVLPGAEGDDTIEGGLGNDSLAGGEGRDRLNGQDGNDTLSGGAGIDTLRGGQGNDTAVFGPGDILAGESFDGGEGEDIADFRPITNADISALALTGVERLIVNGATSIAAGQLADVTAIDSNGQFFFRLIGAAAGTFDFSGISFGNFYQGFTGSAEDDRVIGTLVGGSFDGALGHDTIEGGAGNDSLTGGEGDDSLAGGEGDDSLAGGVGADALAGGAGNDIVAFGAGEIAAGERFDGGEGDDIADFRTIAAGDISALALTGVERLILNGATTIAAGQLADVTTIDSNGLFFFRLIGAAAGTFDFSGISFGNFYQGFTGSAEDDRVIGTLVGGSFDGALGHDTIEGGAGNDSLTGGEGDDSLVGGQGDDSLAGGVGADTLAGGAGNDTAVFNPGDILAGERFDGGEGADIADVRPITNADISALALANVERLILGNGATTIAAGQLADVTTIDSNGQFFFRLIGAAAGTFDFSGITFGSFYQGFTGSAGDDRVIGTGLGDVLAGGEESDTIEGGLGDDNITGGAGDDLLVGGAGDDTLAGGDGIDVALFIGRAARFTVTTSGSTTTVTDTETGAVDRLTGIEEIRFDRRIEFTGTGGDDLIPASPEPMRVAAEAGDDTVFGSVGNDRLRGGRGEDWLSGGDSVDRLAGDQGNDTIDGGAGGDEIEGGGDDDLLTGGQGGDRFVFAPGDGADRITDFGLGEDVLVFLGFGPGFDEAAEVLAAATEVRRDVVIALPDGGSVTLLDVRLSQLEAADIAFA